MKVELALDAKEEPVAVDHDAHGGQDLDEGGWCLSRPGETEEEAVEAGHGKRLAGRQILGPRGRGQRRRELCTHGGRHLRAGKQV